MGKTKAPKIQDLRGFWKLSCCNSNYLFYSIRNFI